MANTQRTHLNIYIENILLYICMNMHRSHRIHCYKSDTKKSRRMKEQEKEKKNVEIVLPYINCVTQNLLNTNASEGTRNVPWMFVSKVTTKTIRKKKPIHRLCHGNIQTSEQFFFSLNRWSASFHRALKLTKGILKWNEW